MASANEIPRKKSPRAPSIALDDALDRVMKVYEKERLHPAPVDVIAQDMGYKDANNGRALAALASLRYYGLVDRISDGLLAVSKDVEAYRYAPSDDLRASYLKKFLTTPPIFGELLDRYSTGLPSDGNLRYELIQRGFLPATAESLVAVLRRSAEFAKAFEGQKDDPGPVEEEPIHETDDLIAPLRPAGAQPAPATSAPAPATPPAMAEDAGHDRIPVRLAGGRRAYLLIPSVLYLADKERLKAQIDLLLTEDDEAAN